jgi:hypothetical protein
VDRDPEERREETRWPSDRPPSEEHEAANEGREGDRRRGQQVPPALETTREPSEATGIREEPFPHEEERPQHHGLERAWWRRIFSGPHEGDAGRSWWRRMFGG